MTPDYAASNYQLDIRELPEVSKRPRREPSPGGAFVNDLTLDDAKDCLPESRPGGAHIDAERVYVIADVIPSNGQSFGARQLKEGRNKICIYTEDLPALERAVVNEEGWAALDFAFRQYERELIAKCDRVIDSGGTGRYPMSNPHAIAAIRKIIGTYGATPWSEIERTGTWNGKWLRSLEVIGAAPKKQTPAVIDSDKRSDEAYHRARMERMFELLTKFVEKGGK